MSRSVKGIFGLLGIAVAGTAIGAGSLLLFMPARPENSGSAMTQITHSSNRSPASASDTQTHSRLDLRFHPRAGERYSYSFRRKITLLGIPETQSPGSPSKEGSVISYQGKLELDVVQSDGKGFSALARASLAEHPVANPVALRVVVNPSGENLEIFGAPLQSDEEKQQASILKDLIAHWDFALLQDTVGTYNAQFGAKASQQGEVVLTKSKLAYTSTFASSPVPPEVTLSSHTLRWNTDLSVPEEIKGREATRMGKTAGSLSAQSEYLIQLVRHSTLLPGSDSLVSRLSEPETLAASGSERDTDTTLVLNSLEWPSILSELQGLNEMNPSEQLKAFGDLVRFLKSHKDSASDLQSLLRAQDLIRLGPQSPLFKTVVGALASAGTPEAQAVALKIYEDPACPKSGKGMILASLTTTQAPLTSSTQDFLARTMKSEESADLSQGAAFALGASLANSTDSSSSSQKEGIQAIRQAWIESTGNLNQQLAVLDAIGNSGQTTYLPELKSAIENSANSVMLRAKAVFALRSMSTSEATLLLVKNLGDSEARIRQAAAQAMAAASWSEAFRKPLQNCASLEPVATIQATCKSALESSAESVVASK